MVHACLFLLQLHHMFLLSLQLFIMCKRIMTSFVFIYYCSLALPDGISYHSWLACTSLYIVHIHVGHYTKFLISNQGTWSISVLRTEKPWKVLFSSNPILCELFDLCDSRWLSLHNMEFELIVSCCRWIFSMFFFSVVNYILWPRFLPIWLRRGRISFVLC